MSKPERPPVADGLLTLAEAAAYLRVCPRTVRSYLKRGLLSGRLIARQWRFRRKVLEELYENAPSVWVRDGKDKDEK